MRDTLKEEAARIKAMREALESLERAATSMIIGISVHNERKQYGPIVGAVPDALAHRAAAARAVLAAHATLAQTGGD